MSGAQPCRWCGAPIVVRMVRGGRAWPFNRDLARAEEVGEASFVPVSSGGRVVMVPAVELPERRLVVHPWRAVRHVCAEWVNAHRPDDGVEDLGAALAAAFGLPDVE